MAKARSLGIVALVHLSVVLAAPVVSALLFMCLTLGAHSVNHFGGALAFGAGILFCYIYYGPMTALLVLVASPLFWALARLRSRTLALVLAGILGAALGWLFAQYLLAGEDKEYILSAALAAAITGVCAGLGLEFAWRR